MSIVQNPRTLVNGRGWCYSVRLNLKFIILPLCFNHSIFLVKKNHIHSSFLLLGERQFYGCNKIVGFSSVHEKMHSNLFKTKQKKVISREKTQSYTYNTFLLSWMKYARCEICATSIFRVLFPSWNPVFIPHIPCAGGWGCFCCGWGVNCIKRRGMKCEIVAWNHFSFY